MTDSSAKRCTRCQGEICVKTQYGGGPLKLACAGLVMVLGVGLMLLSPPRPLLAVPATMLLALALAMMLRREELLVCKACQAARPEDCTWLQSREGATT